MQVIDQTTRAGILALYDQEDPVHGGMIPGYDRDHAERTARIMLRVANALRLDPSWHQDIEITTLLHDIGRAGMNPKLFGQIFSLAQENGLPVRIQELRSRYPEVSEANATEFFLTLIQPALKDRQIPIDDQLIDHVRMRMDFKARLTETLSDRQPQLNRLGITVKPWMQKVMLYYYYPQELVGEPEEIGLIGMMLVACENFEAYNNWRRGRDYYARPKQRLRDVFTSLQVFQDNGLVSHGVLAALRNLTNEAALISIVKESRDMPPDSALPKDDLKFLEEIAGK